MRSVIVRATGDLELRVGDPSEGADVKTQRRSIELRDALFRATTAAIAAWSPLPAPPRGEYVLATPCLMASIHGRCGSASCNWEVAALSELPPPVRDLVLLVQTLPSHPCEHAVKLPLPSPLPEKLPERWRVTLTGHPPLERKPVSFIPCSSVWTVGGSIVEVSPADYRGQHYCLRSQEEGQRLYRAVKRALAASLGGALESTAQGQRHRLYSLSFSLETPGSMISCSWEFKELAEFPTEVRPISDVLERCTRVRGKLEDSGRDSDAP